MIKGLVLVADMPETVKVVVLGMVVEFNAMFAGLKEQFVQLREMVSVKLGI